MRRVRSFLLTTTSLPPQSLQSGRILKIPDAANQICADGWHKTWDTALKMMSEAPTAEVIVADASTKQVIAIFGAVNHEQPSEDIKRVNRNWKSTPIPKLDNPMSLWCNLNCTEFGWDLVSGAARDVPFRLNFFEQQSLRNPNGIVSRGRAWLAEIRDWYSPAKKIM